MRVIRLAAVLAAIAAIVGGAAVASTGRSSSPAASPSPPVPAGAPASTPTQPAGPDAAVLAEVVRSWGQCSSGSLVWDDLNANWQSYGTKKIKIDYSNPDLCGTTPITLSALEASGAKVVILSDPCGGLQ
jgi:hypothetical protein